MVMREMRCCLATDQRPERESEKKNSKFIITIKVHTCTLHNTRNKLVCVLASVCVCMCYQLIVIIVNS